jgi:ferredoxin
MKLTIDAKLCSGQGRCSTLAPELLTGDDDGFVTARGTTITTPVGQEAAARECRARLPGGAVSIEE